MTTPPFGFAPVAPVAPAAAAAVPPVPAAAPDLPPVGGLVTWPEYDVYDELRPEKVRFGLVVGYDPAGAAQVLTLHYDGLAHFGPVPTTEGPHGPTVADLTVLA